MDEQSDRMSDEDRRAQQDSELSAERDEHQARVASDAAENQVLPSEPVPAPSVEPAAPAEPAETPPAEPQTDSN